MIDELMSSSLSGGYQGGAARLIRLHFRGLHFHRSLATRLSCATGVGRSDAFRSTRYVLDSDQREKNPIDDLFDVLRQQRLLQEHELMAHEGDRQRSQARRKFLSSDFAASDPAGQNFHHYFDAALVHFRKERGFALVEKLRNQAKDNFWTQLSRHF